jgi:RNA polymerase sigma-70 factor, ECF subfamily
VDLPDSRDRGARDARIVPESSLGAELDNDGPSLGIERFVGKHGRGMWAQPLSRWSEIPDERLLIRETFDLLQQTISKLPPNQRRVLVLRDVEGWASEEVRELLDISEVNQRVLLHRARSFVRSALEREFTEAGDAA